MGGAIKNTTKFCIVCDCLIRMTNMSGYCRAHANQDKNRQSKKVAWLRANSDARRAASETSMRWATRHPNKKNAANKAYQDAKRQRTPPWLTDEHRAAIEEIYGTKSDLQWLSEERLEVDHIIPLRGKNVSGLNVPWNLQIISERENCRKYNRESAM